MMIELKINKFQVDNLRCKIKCKKDEKEILKGIDCNFSGGKVIGILGPSGSGKTCFLNCLSGYKSGNASVTSIEINGFSCSFKFIKNISCYVTQEIYLNESLTVDENMKSTANFKLGSSTSNVEKDQKILDILIRFGLMSLKNNKTRDLSGGEKKRLAIALELINDPQIIFIDEPTSGLDISAARNILCYLNILAKMGKMVICSLHQVTAAHLNLLDLLFILGEGKCVYQGSPQNLVPFLEEVGLPCSIYHNPADYIIEICNGDLGAEKLDILVKATAKELQIRNKKSQRENINDAIGIYYFQNNSSWFSGLRTLMQRELLKTKRNFMFTAIRILASLFIAFSAGILFYGKGNDANEVFSTYNLGLTVIASLFTGSMFATSTVPLEMNVVKREIYNKNYTIGQYYLIFTLLDFPITLFCSIIPSLIMYAMSGQPIEIYRVLLFLVISLLSGFLYQSIGTMYGTLLNLTDAIFINAAVNLAFLSFGGFGLLLSHLPWWVTTLSRCLYTRHTISGIMSVFWGFNRATLECSEQTYCYFKDGNKFLKEIGVDANEFWIDVAILAGWFTFIKIVTYFTIKLRIAKA